MKLARSKKYREQFVAAQVKKSIPLQIRKLLRQHQLSQEILAERAGLTQGVVSRAANPDYGNLTLNTLVKIAAGFDVAFIAKFVPFTELERWFAEFSEDSLEVDTFEKENAELGNALLERGGLEQSTSAQAGVVIPIEEIMKGHEQLSTERKGPGIEHDYSSARNGLMAAYAGGQMMWR